MTTISFEPRSRDAALAGVVARMSDDGWGHYHRLDCAFAPQRGRRESGPSSTVHGAICRTTGTRVRCVTHQRSNVLIWHSATVSAKDFVERG